MAQRRRGNQPEREIQPLVAPGERLPRRKEAPREAPKPTPEKVPEKVPA